MTDKIDRRLEELVNKLAASAPEAPPFPHTTAPSPIKPRRAPAWVLTAAGAAAVLVIIGLPFLLFGGRTTDKDVATTLPSTPTTAAPTPETTVPAAPAVAPCTPAGLRVQALAEDGAAGHVVTPLRFSNTSGGPCLLEDPIAVTGIGTGGEEVAAPLSSGSPVPSDSGARLEAGQWRTMLLEVGTACEGGRTVGPEAEAVRISLAGGDVLLGFVGDLGCDFSYSPFGDWLEVGSVGADERALVDALDAFAEDPTVARFSELPFSDSVTLTLGPEISRSQFYTTLSDTAAWEFEESDGFRGYVGPFSALDLLAQDRELAVTAGPHDHCAGPPMPIYDGFAGLRQISIQPTGATSCLEWWVVDLFLTESGDIAGVTLDLWEP